MSRHPLLRRPLHPTPAIRSREDLSRLLGEDAARIATLVADPRSAYGLLLAPKKQGGFREIHPPCPALKRIQRQALRVLEARFRPPAWVHGGVAGRSILTHAAPHLAKTMVATLDVRDFFPSVDAGRVRAILAGAGFEAAALDDFVALVTLDGRLPQGAPTSGWIANLAFDAADRAILALAARRGLAYTRYVDDLALSGDCDFGELRGPFVEAVEKRGFRVAPEKVAFMGRFVPQVVTGLLVNDRLRPTRAFRDELRAEVLAFSAGRAAALPSLAGLEPHECRARLLGRIRHLQRFDPEDARRLERRLGMRRSAVTAARLPASERPAGVAGSHSPAV